MEIQRDSDLFKAFSKNYWEYFLELERIPSDEKICRVL